MKKLLITVVVFAGLLLAVDRIGAHVAGTVVAGQLRTSAGLQSDPTVSILGFPFLTQAVGGRYGEIDVLARNVNRGGVRLSEIDTTLIGARIPLRDALSGKVTAVPVEGLTARVVATYADVSGMSDISGLQIAPSGTSLKVSGRVTVLGQTLTATATSTVALAGNELVITAQSLAIDGQSSGPLLRALAGRFDFRVKVGNLPYGLQLKTVTVEPNGLVLIATTGATVLTTR